MSLNKSPPLKRVTKYINNTVTSKSFRVHSLPHYPAGSTHFPISPSFFLIFLGLQLRLLQGSYVHVPILSELSGHTLGPVFIGLYIIYYWCLRVLNMLRKINHLSHRLRFSPYSI